MARDLKQSTTATIVVGPIVYATNGYTVWQSYDITTMVCAIGKAGVAPAGLTLTASGGDNDMTDAASMPGWYELELQPTNVGTLGPMRIMFDNSDILPFWEDFHVRTANAYDTLYSTDQWDVNVAAITASIITAAAIASDAIAAAKIASGALTSDVQGVIETNNLDHLMKIACASITMADEVVTDTVISRILSSGDVSAYECTTDSLQPFRDALATTASIADAVWDEVLHASMTGRQVIGILLPAFAAGKASGAGTTAITFRDVGDGFNAIAQTVDASGNRTAVDVTFTA